MIHKKAGLTFFECYLEAPLKVLKERDPNGVYSKENKSETGGTSPDFDFDTYNVPENPEFRLDTDTQTIRQCVNEVFQKMIESKVIERIAHIDPNKYVNLKSSFKDK